MTDSSPNYHNYIYSAIVFFGIVICMTAITISISKINYFEHNTNRIHRLITSSEIELDTLEKEASIIDSTIIEINKKINNKPAENKKLTKEFLNLKLDITKLRTDIAEKQKLLITLNLLKTSTLSQIKTLFWVNSILLVIGTLMVLIGAAALGFRLEIFKERRSKQRA